MQRLLLLVCIASLPLAGAASLRAQESSLVRSEAADLAKSIGLGVSGRQSVDRALDLERQSRRLDSLPESVDDEKFLAHAVLVDYYRTSGVADLVRYHARRALAFAQNLAPDSRLQFASITFGVYRALASMSAQAGDVGTAQMILANIPGDIAEAPAVARPLALMKGRYALVGKPVPALNGASWINASSNPLSVPAPADERSSAGSATVIEFTGWWCGPCHESYPYLRDLSGKFPGKSVRVVFVTARMGQFRERKSLSRDKEIALLADYFGKEEKLPFPVGVVDSASAPMSDFFVDEIPELIVVDGAGVVHGVMLGWNTDVEQRMTQQLGEILNTR